MLKKERGSALLITLLMITIFSILFLSLSSGSITNIKQIKATENDLQSTALAEMGVQYQKSKMITVMAEFFNNFNNIDTLFEEFLERPEVKNMSDQQIELEFQDFVKQKLIEELDSELSDPDVDKVYLDDPNNTQYYQIVHKENTIIDDKISVQFTSIGNNSEKEKRIDADFRLSLNNIGVSAEHCSVSIDGAVCKTKNNGPGGDTMPNGQQIQEPKNLQSCQGNNFLSGANCQVNGSAVLGNGNNEFSNTTVKITGTLNNNGNMNNANNSTVWIDGSLTNGNFNNADNLKLHVGGTANFNGNVNNLSKSIIEIMGSATFANNAQNISETSIYIGGTASFNGQVDLENKSKVYVNGDTTISKHLNVSADSKFCVNGRLTINGQYKGGTNVYAKTSNNPNVNTNPADFAANCTSDGTGPSDDGLKPVADINNDDWNDYLDSSFDY